MARPKNTKQKQNKKYTRRDVPHGQYVTTPKVNEELHNAAKIGGTPKARNLFDQIKIA